jgi:DNA-binding NtrC family response regulator
MANILLVDDDPDVVGSFSAALEAHGHELATASTAAEGLALARDDRPDAVVLEATIGGGTAGLELARTLAREFPGLPLVMVSRDDGLPMPARATVGGDGAWVAADRFMEKPVMPDVLVYEVEHLLPETARHREGRLA